VATAIAGLGAVGSGGCLFGDSTGSSVASEKDIKGSCAAAAPDGGAVQCASGNQFPVVGCLCGPGGVCDTSVGACVASGCRSGAYLDSSGTCRSVYWFDGHLPSSSTHSCYGSPPFLG
jgi:hypothetical protein